MKKIIRLTESDLARIVRRVISEGTEGTKMTAQSSTELTLGDGTKVSVVNKKGEKLNFIATPSRTYDANNKVKPGKIFITLSLSGKPKTKVSMTYDCTTSTLNRPSSPTVLDNYTDVNVKYANRGSNFDQTNGAILMKTIYGVDGGSFSTTNPPFSNIISSYCKSV